MTAGLEKRRFQRVPQDLRARLSGWLSDYEPPELRIVDLSAGGAGFESRHKLMIGEVVEFELPLAIPVPVKAIVVWSAPKEGDVRKYGAIFTGIEPEHLQVLKSYIHLQMNALGLEPLEGDLTT